ncbi:MAG: PAS domain S-box protein, partial [Bacteroidetes bacterium]
MNTKDFLNRPDILEHFSEGFLLLDTEGKIIIWNKALEEISGMKREEALNRYHHEVMFEFVIPEKRTPQTLQFYKAMLTDALSNGSHPLT